MREDFGAGAGLPEEMDFFGIDEEGLGREALEEVVVVDGG